MTRPYDFINRLFTHPAWMGNAPCKGLSDIMFYDKGGDMHAKANRARAICAGCPHKLACLEYAIDNNEDHGVWGGRTVRERRQIARNRRAMGWKTGRLRQVERAV